MQPETLLLHRQALIKEVDALLDTILSGQGPLPKWAVRPPQALPTEQPLTIGPDNPFTTHYNSLQPITTQINSLSKPPGSRGIECV